MRKKVRMKLQWCIVAILEEIRPKGVIHVLKQTL